MRPEHANCAEVARAAMGAACSDMAREDPCPFCSPAPGAVAADSVHALALRDAYPVAPGHLLVVPRRHVASVFDLDEEEWADLWGLVRHVCQDSPGLRDAEGLNVGTNVGRAAGQTVAHAHVHLIPRSAGDVPDPRGGVRWVIPATADYWSRGQAPESGAARCEGT